MIRTEVILNGKLTEKYFPISWDNVTYKQFLELAECGDDDKKVLSVFSGIDPETIRKAKINNLIDVVSTLSFLRHECPARVPERLLFYPMPKDLGLETIGQYEDIKSELAKLKGSENKIDQLKLYPFICAVYACRHMSRQRCLDLVDKLMNNGRVQDASEIVYGDYHYLKAEAMTEEFLNAPAPEVLGIGNFTVLNLIGLNIGINPNYRKQITRVKRLKLALKRWWLRLVFSRPVYTWRKRLGLKTVSFLSIVFISFNIV